MTIASVLYSLAGPPPCTSALSLFNLFGAALNVPPVSALVAHVFRFLVVFFMRQLCMASYIWIDMYVCVSHLLLFLWLSFRPWNWNLLQFLFPLKTLTLTHFLLYICIALLCSALLCLFCLFADLLLQHAAFICICCKLQVLYRTGGIGKFLF